MKEFVIIWSILVAGPSGGLEWQEFDRKFEEFPSIKACEVKATAYKSRAEAFAPILGIPHEMKFECKDPTKEATD